MCQVDKSRGGFWCSSNWYKKKKEINEKREKGYKEKKRRKTKNQKEG